MKQRRRGGVIGIIVIAAYAILRFGFLAYREHEDGMSTTGIVWSIVGIAAGILVVMEIVFAIVHAHTRSRERALATLHPGAHLAPVVLKRDLVPEIQQAASMLGLSLQHRIPRSGYATVVADHQGIGIYTGGSEPRLLLGIARGNLQQVGAGVTSAGGRAAFGQKVESLHVVATTGEYWTAIDLPIYRTVLGFPKTLRAEELDDRVRAIALAAGVHMEPAPR